MKEWDIFHSGGEEFQTASEGGTCAQCSCPRSVRAHVPKPQQLPTSFGNFDEAMRSFDSHSFTCCVNSCPNTSVESIRFSKICADPGSSFFVNKSEDTSICVCHYLQQMYSLFVVKYIQNKMRFVMYMASAISTKVLEMQTQ